MSPDLRVSLAEALHAEVERTQVVHGGDINDAYRVRLADGRELFVKSHAQATPRMFACEAAGLSWLAEAKALRVPEVLAVSPNTAPGTHFLALELVRSNHRARDYEERLGRGLAELHLAGADAFGLSYDNFIGTLEQHNQPEGTWSAFYARRRLEPLCRRAVDRGIAPRSWTRAFARLAARLPALVGRDEPPARLHGDLWSGNVITDERGHPCLIDPAVYGGHREMDLAMLALFGGMNRRILDAYHERYPLAPGHEERVLLYQLYPLLVHVNLFGGGYVGSTERALRRYA